MIYMCSCTSYKWAAFYIKLSAKVTNKKHAPDPTKWRCGNRNARYANQINVWKRKLSDKLCSSFEMEAYSTWIRTHKNHVTYFVGRFAWWASVIDARLKQIHFLSHSTVIHKYAYRIGFIKNSFSVYKLNFIVRFSHSFSSDHWIFMS